MNRVSGFGSENISLNLTKCLFNTDVLEMFCYRRIFGVLSIPRELFTLELF